MSEKYSSILRKVYKQNIAWLPFILLTLVGSTLFLTEKRDGGSIEGSIADCTSAHGITLSRNILKTDYPLFMFSSREIRDDKIVYEAYNRFPIFSFLLTGLIIRPFENDIQLQLYMARQFMNLFFLLSIIFVYKLVEQLTKNKSLALIVTFISFSSYYLLSFNNMIFNDIPALFGFVVAIHCIVKANRTQLKLSQILFYSLIPVSLGWQPYAVFGAWLLIDSFELLLKKSMLIKVKVVTFFKQQSFIISGFAAIWGVILLSLQLYNEWMMVGGAFKELPSVSSALWKSGIVSATKYTTLTWTYEWFNFLPSQCHTISVILTPFWPIFQIEPGFYAPIFLVVILIIHTSIRYFKDKIFVNKFHMILILSGFFWTIPMKHFVALHEFQSIFYIGFAISVFLSLFSYMKINGWNILAFNVAIVFIISISLSNYYKKSHYNQFTKQLQNIHMNLPLESKIYFEGNRRENLKFSRYAIEFYLSDCIFTNFKDAEYIISKNPDFNNNKLTFNTELNLFKTTKNPD